jgi:hypothetical protein
MPEEKKAQLTPLSDNLEAALKIWWKNLKKFIFVYLWGMLFALIPLAIIAIFIGLDFAVGRGTNLPLHAIMIAVTVVGFLAVMYFSMRAYMGMFLLVKKNYEGDELVIFKETSKYFWSYLWVTLLTAILVILWSCLLIIPGIIYGIFYSFAVYVYFFEDKRGMVAIRRSQELVKGYWWAVFGRFLAIGLLVWLVMVVASLPLAFSSPQDVFYQAWNIVVQAVSFLIGPIILLYTYNIYQDLVRIKK